MEENSITDIIGDLKAQKDRLRKELAEVRQRQKELTRELDRVQAGLAGLHGRRFTPEMSAAVKSKRSGRKSEPSDPKWMADLESIVASILETEGPMAEIPLRAKCISRMKQNGMAMDGAEDRLSIVLQGERFNLGPSGWKVAEYRMQTSPETQPTEADPQV